jgi:dihydroflavonol-4-reductase
MNLVTGATGIVGSHVVLALLQNNQPVTACRQKSSDITKVEKLFAYYTPEHRQLFEKIKWVELDVRNIFSIEEALEGISTVYHCAGLVSFHKSDRSRLFEINEKGTRNMVDACLAKNIGALCHVSSVATVNNLDYILPLNEEVFWKKSGKESDYAISKYNAEREVWRGTEEGLNAVIVNPGIILSPGFWHQSSSKLFTSAYKGTKFYTTGVTGYIGAPDVANAMLALTEKKLFANRYILVEDNYTYQHIFTTIQANFNKPAPSIKIPRALLNALRVTTSFLSLFTGKSPGLTKSVVQAAYSTQQLSNAKIKNTLPVKWTPVDEAIATICRHYLGDLQH